ncbi:MAG: hypothetical protein V3S51_00970 [Dehalococcoidia bacterium]
MSTKVKVSSLLRKFTDWQEIVEVAGRSPEECLGNLEALYPDLRRWLYDKHGELRPQIWLFVNGERIGADEMTAPMNDSDELFLMLAVGGG